MLKQERDEFFEKHKRSFQHLEDIVVGTYNALPEMLDYSADRVYEALMREYKAELNGTPKPKLNLPDSDMTLYYSLRNVTEQMLDRSDLPPKFRDDVGRETMDDIVAILKALRKSVNFWNKQNGRQGYLNYVSQFFE
jgi:hypothetical protein